MAEAIAYHRAADVEDALAHVRRYGDDSRLVSGGTALAILMRQGLVAPGVLIGVAEIAELLTVAPLPDGGLRIGAAVPLRRLEHHPLVQAGWPLLVSALRAVATPRIRNMATIGGALAHADPAEDPPVALAALDATVIARGARERRIACADFAVDYYENALLPGEMIVAVELPPSPPTSAGAYLKFLPRSVDDYGVVTAAAHVDVRDGICTHARLCLGAVAARPVNVELGSAVVGRPPDEATFTSVAERVFDLVDPLADVRGSASYKRSMAVVFARRALLAAARAATERATARPGATT